MFGTLRLILALLVLASHVEVSHLLDVGCVAVTIFFLLSGFVMTATVRRYYASAARYGWFLADRAGRILPQYLFWTGICVLWVYYFDNSWAPVGPREIVENIVLLPAMFAVFDLRPWLTGTRFITQAWSLSLEWYFYLLVPGVVLIPRLRLLSGLLSFGVFALATLNLISPYVYAYRLLPGVLFIFLLGSVAYDEIERPAFGGGTNLLTPFVALALLGLVANSCKTLHVGYTSEVFVGVMGGLPLLLWLARQPQRQFDNLLGNLSYGVFLCHNLVLRILDQHQVFPGRWVQFVEASSISMILAALSYYAVERPFVVWRHSLRHP